MQLIRASVAYKGGVGRTPANLQFKAFTDHIAFGAGTAFFSTGRRQAADILSVAGFTVGTLVSLLMVEISEHL